MITLISNVGQLITPLGRGAAFGGAMGDVKTLRDVEIVLRDGRIDRIGADVCQGTPDETIDAGGRVVLPALADPHVHVPRLVPGDGEAELEGSERKLLQQLRRWCRRAFREGTASLEMKCGGERDPDELTLLRAAQEASANLPLRVDTTLFLDGRAEDATRDDRISDLIGRVIPTVKRRRAGRFCDVACGAGRYSGRDAEAVLRAALSAGLRPKVHAVGDETEEAARLAGSLNAASIDHLSDCGARAARALRRAGVVCVLLPGSAFLRGTAYPSARRMIGDGLSVALGSGHGDGERALGSMWTVLALGIEKMRLTFEEALTACTLNAAAAMENADETGTLETGKSADLVILDMEDVREICGSVGSNPVHEAIVGGQRMSES